MDEITGKQQGGQAGFEVGQQTQSTWKELGT
jgi:hypothetical protein